MTREKGKVSWVWHRKKNAINFNLGRKHRFYYLILQTAAPVLYLYLICLSLIFLFPPVSLKPVFVFYNYVSMSVMYVIKFFPYIKKRAIYTQLHESQGQKTRMVSVCHYTNIFHNQKQHKSYLSAIILQKTSSLLSYGNAFTQQVFKKISPRVE